MRNSGKRKAIPRHELSLYWQRCQAGKFAQATQVGRHNCSVFPDEMMQGSVIFNSLTQKAVGFYFLSVEIDPRIVVAYKGGVIGFAPEVLNHVEAMFSVSPYDKLSVSWGTLKNTQ